MDLESLAIEALQCHKCVLSQTRTTVVFGSGDPHAKVMLVGEAPGKNEDLGGEPFIGAAGKFLNELIAAAGLIREQVYIANVIKCRPPGNRNPKPAEIAECAPFLQKQIDLIEPLAVVALGTFAAQALLATKEPISSLRGSVVEVDGRTVFPVFHPAAAIYDRSKRGVLLQDFSAIGTFVSAQPKNP